MANNTKMKSPLIVLDTNVLVAALRSRQGKSSQLLRAVGSGGFDFVLSVPLLFEYEDVLKRPEMVPVSMQAIENMLDYLCQQGDFQKIFYLWRPHLKDPKDDMVLELALNAKAQAIVTHNIKDFRNANDLGVEILTPSQFLQKLEAKSWQH